MCHPPEDEDGTSTSAVDNFKCHPFLARVPPHSIPQVPVNYAKFLTPTQKKIDQAKVTIFLLCTH